jgi:F0F1-type ATP synthase assembly protein I
MTKTSQMEAKTKSPNGTFMVMTLDMSWRLAAVVLVPIAVGSKLDNSFKLKPVFTVVGLLMAAAGTAWVIRSTIQKADQAMAVSAKAGKHD